MCCCNSLQRLHPGGAERFHLQCLSAHRVEPEAAPAVQLEKIQLLPLPVSRLLHPIAALAMRHLVLEQLRGPAHNPRDRNSECLHVGKPRRTVLGEGRGVRAWGAWHVRNIVVSDSAQAGVSPTRRHDNVDWLPSDSKRQPGGMSLGWRAACIGLRGDWQECPHIGMC